MILKKLRLKFGIPPVKNHFVLLLWRTTEASSVLPLSMILGGELPLIVSVDDSMNSRVRRFSTQTLIKLNYLST
ncbi:hypothetical protein RYX36_036394, partial [Vicia faba]